MIVSSAATVAPDLQTFDTDLASSFLFFCSLVMPFYGCSANIDIFRVHYRFVALDCSVAVNIDAGKCPVRHTDLHD